MRARLLKEVFGYAAFRGAQEEIVDHVVGGGDALVLMPTGGGKSLCYQVPALLRAGHRRRRLAADRADAGPGRRAATRPACAPRSSTRRSTPTSAARSSASCWRGELDLLYVAPERAADAALPATLDSLHERGRSRCSRSTRRTASRQWGHDFRAGVPAAVACCTSASRACRASRSPPPPTRRRAREIVERLELERRARLRRQLRPAQHPLHASSRRTTPRAQLLRFLRDEHAGEAGIVYCLSRKKVEETAAWLHERGRRARCPTTPAWTPRTRARSTRTASCARTAS